MIRVTRFNGTVFYINAEQIQTVEGTPDTVITLMNEIKVIVKEPPEEVVAAIIKYRQNINTNRFNQESGV